LENGTYTSAVSCLTASKQMLNGYKFHLFLLQLSFIGWWILVGISLGLVGIYVIPYFNTAQTLFYNKLSKHLQTQG
ncbi:DUF975 family protein, partial [Enterococcus faecalis]|nr:DUF975 family protein [Enterococcus faecalis]